MRLTLEPSSQREQANTVFPICIKRTNLPGSPNFLIGLFWSTALHSFETNNNSLSPVILPETRPFIKLCIEGIIWMASIRGNLIVRSSSIFLHFVSSRSFRDIFAGIGYGTLGMYSRGGTDSTGVVNGVGSVSACCSVSPSDRGTALDCGFSPSFCLPFSSADSFLGIASGSLFPLLSATALHF